MSPRKTIASVVACLAVLATGSTAAADAYPNKPVKILFGFPAASATDFIARTVGDKLGQKWGQPIVIDNRPGAGGNLGSELAAKQPADGYTIFFGTVANAISTTFYSKLGYDYLKDFTPITLVATTPLVVVVNPSLPIHDTASKPGMSASETVGTSGSAGARLALVTAITRSLPLLMCGIAAAMLSNMTWTRPLKRSVYAAGVPLYGTCVICMPVAVLNISPARWLEVPRPPDPKFTSPG